jgi:hypothetical protein
VWEAGTGAAFRRDTVLVTGDGPELLTSAPSADPINVEEPL